jgi:hypothetical protein
MKITHALMGFAFGAVIILPTHANAAVSTTSASSVEWSYKRLPIDREFGSEVTSRQTYEDDPTLKVYMVRNNRLYEDKNAKINKYDGSDEDVEFRRIKNTNIDEYNIWNMFTGIADKDFVKKNLALFVTFRDPDSGVFGQVWRVADSEPSWALAINVNGADFGSKKWQRDMVITLLH